MNRDNNPIIAIAAVDSAGGDDNRADLLVRHALSLSKTSKHILFDAAVLTCSLAGKKREGELQTGMAVSMEVLTVTSISIGFNDINDYTSAR